MSEAATVDETVQAVLAEMQPVEPASVIDDEYLRALALELNPYVAVGRGEPPVANLRPRGWLADVVESVGWDEAEAKFPEVGSFLGRLRGTLEGIVAGA